MSYKVSVIIPFYSNKKWLIEALNSVYNQTYKNFEIIVVNDGSKENISDLETTFTDKIIFHKQDNQGAAIARNNGIDLSNGEYIAFLDSDDLWMPTKLEEQISFMEINNFQWSHTDYTRFWDSIQKEIYVRCVIENNIFPQCLIWNPIATPCVIIRKNILLNYLNMRFEPGRKVGEDGYLWQQIGEKYKLGYLKKSLSRVRIRGGNNAAFQAHLQLKHRSDTIEVLKKYKNKFDNKIFYFYYLFLLKYCSYSWSLISIIAKTFNRNNSSLELLFKFVYLFPYINFRILRKMI